MKRYWVCDAGKFVVQMATNDFKAAQTYAKELCVTQRRYHFVYDHVKEVYINHPQCAQMIEEHKTLYQESIDKYPQVVKG